MTALKLIVFGKVQGVFFRKETQKIATILGVFGYVKNLSDGSVEVHVEGTEEFVFKVIDFCHHGPENAAVQNVSIQSASIQNFISFEILP